MNRVDRFMLRMVGKVFSHAVIAAADKHPLFSRLVEATTDHAREMASVYRSVRLEKSHPLLVFRQPRTSCHHTNGLFGEGELGVSFCRESATPCNLCPCQCFQCVWRYGQRVDVDKFICVDCGDKYSQLRPYARGPVIAGAGKCQECRASMASINHYVKRVETDGTDA